MLRNRIILATVIIGTGVLASFYGGSAARILFYMSLIIPAMSVIYAFYVYFRFRIYQHVERRVVVKGESVPYSFVLSNEDFISYANVKVTFLSDFSEVQNMEFSKSYRLTPKEKIESSTQIRCNYRGEYKVGIESIVVTDFLGLIQIRYPAPSTLGMSVLPRLIKLSKLSLTPVDDDAKLSRFSQNRGTEQIDTEMRKYISGDSLKLVNWKVSAKKNELFTRKYADTPKSRITFIADMRKCEKSELECSVIEDKIIESMLAVSHYLVGKRMPVRMIYEYGDTVAQNIVNIGDFNDFYAKCADITFFARQSPEELMLRGGAFSSTGNFLIIATSSLTAELYSTCLDAVLLGNDVAIIYISDSADIGVEMPDSRITLCRVSYSDDIADILGGEQK